MLTKLFAIGFLLWSAFIALAAGFVGAGLACEGGDCRYGSPSWFEPWTWGEYSVYPEAGILAVIGLVPASAFVAFAITRRRWRGALALVTSLVLLSYTYFGGLTPEGRATFSFGPVLGVVALAFPRRG